MHAGFFFSSIILSLHTKADGYKIKVTSCRLCSLHIHRGGLGFTGGKETPTTVKYDAKNSPSAGSVGVTVTRWSKRMDGGKEGMQMWNSNSNGLQGPRTNASALLGGGCTVSIYKNDGITTQKWPPWGPLGTGWVSRETDAFMGCINTKMHELFRVKYIWIEYLNLQFARGGILAAQGMNLHILLTKVNKRD